MEWRTGKQCRERYINQLDPNIKKTPWTIEEDTTIKRLHDQLGKKWSKFMDYLPGRSDNAIKNRWHVISRDNYVEEAIPGQVLPQIDTPLAVSVNQENKSTIKAKKHVKSSAVRVLKKETGLETLRSVNDEAIQETDGCELLGLEGGDIDFDLCSFTGNETYVDNTLTSPSYTPRTTNELGECVDAEATHNYSYSHTNSVVSSSSNGESSNRDSPIDAELLNELIHLDEDTPNCSRKPSLQCMTSHEPSSSEDGHSVSDSAPTSPMRASPKTNLNIQTTSSLTGIYEFFFEKPSIDGANARDVKMTGEQTQHPAASNVHSRPFGPNGLIKEPPSQEQANQEGAVVWSLDPNEDLAQALEFLMSATNSPAHAMGMGTSSNRNSFGSAASGSGRPPPISISTRSFSTSRSPTTSLYGGISLTGADSPATGARVRPMSGNLASMASLLSRSGSGHCDAELFLAPPRPAAEPSGPFVVPGAGYNFHHNVIGINNGGIDSTANNSLRLQVPVKAEHSPMNHTHFSPACPDSKRPRGKNPSYFSW